MISISALSKTRYRLEFSWGKVKMKWKSKKMSGCPLVYVSEKKFKFESFHFASRISLCTYSREGLSLASCFFFYLVLRSLILLGPLVGVFCHCDRGCWCQHLNEQQKHRCDIALSSKHSALNNDHEMSHHPISLTITVWREIRTIKVIKCPLSSAP